MTATRHERYQAASLRSRRPRVRLTTQRTIGPPLRGRPLRDRYVLRLIALDRVVHFLVLAAIVAAIFLFAQDRAQLHDKGIFSEINRAFALSTTKLYVVGAIVVALYTVILGVEAVGLWSARRWAEYLTLVETAVLVPFEIYELTSKTSPLKILTLIINLAVVTYLLVSKRLFGIRGGGKAEKAERQADAGWRAIENATPT